MPSPQEIAPVIALLTVMVIPITVILTRHQQKMTLLMRQENNSLMQPQSDLQSIQYDVQQLKSMVATLAVSVDSLKEEVRNANSIQDRVRINE